MVISDFVFFLMINFFVRTYSSSSAKTTAIFAFGDSIMDSGNNNGLITIVRSDHPPYGIDLPGHVPTGRFTNGRLTTDILALKLGIKEMLPAYLNPNLTDKDLLTGVSFASGGSGLDNFTAQNSGTISIYTQLDYFAQALKRIDRQVGKRERTRIVKNAIFIIGTGVNDVMVNFYDLPFRRFSFSLPDYHDFLLRELRAIIQRLYKMGARKLAVTGLPPIGCLPIQMTLESFIPTNHMLQRLCIDQINKDCKVYNIKIQKLLSRLQASLSGIKVAYADIYTPIFHMMKYPSKYGFENTLEGCCGTGMMEMGPLCNSLMTTCSDPSKFLFWDAVHPTEAMYRVLTETFQEKVLPQLGIN